jgi:hypothetical protein
VSATARGSGKPIRWTSIDAEVAAALDRQADLHGRWLEAQAEARAAHQRIAEADRSGQRRRAEAIALGRTDPGAPDLAEAERAAEAAGSAASALGEAFEIARRRALELADRRAAAWAQQASAEVDRTARELGEAVATLEAAYRGWRAARAQVVLATTPELRQRGRDRQSGHHRLEALGVDVEDVIAALRTLPDSERSQLANRSPASSVAIT